MRIVERDRVGKCAPGQRNTASSRQVLLQIDLEVEQEHGEFRRPGEDLSEVGERNINERRSRAGHRAQRVLEDRVQLGAKAFEFAGHADARSPEPTGIEELHVVLWNPVSVTARRRIARVGRPLDDGSQHCGGIGNATSVRAGRILGMRDRHDTGPADQPHRRFDADYPVMVRRADDAAVGLRPDGDRGEVGRRGGAGP